MGLKGKAVMRSCCRVVLQGLLYVVGTVAFLGFAVLGVIGAGFIVVACLLANGVEDKGVECR